MEKRTIWKLTLIFLPFFAMMAAGTPSAVTVYNTADSTVACCSFFTLVEGAGMGICLPLAAICCGLCLAFAAAHWLMEKRWQRKAVLGTSFAAMTLAVLPIVIRSEIVLLPNMMVPILMGAECLIAWIFIRKELPARAAKRLKNR